MSLARHLRIGLTLVLPLALGGCNAALSLLNPDFAGLLTSSAARSIPGDNPALLVYTQNRTSRWVQMTISYRTTGDEVVQYTTSLNPGDKSGQLLVCPITEITLGSVSDLSEVGISIAASPGALGAGVSVDQVPTIDVEAFGVLLRESVNYDCGDSLTFVVQPSSDTASGFQTLAFRRVGGATSSQ